MSGFRLRALLEETDLYSTAPSTNDNSKGTKKLEWGTHNPASAAIFQNTDIWGNAGDDNDFNLEFMELDEFLSETGLGGVDNDLLNKATQSLVEAESASAELSQLESLLKATPDSTTAPSVTHTLQELNANQSPSPSTALEAKLNESGKIAKRRQYSEDGEGLTDTAVVVVPGRDGFDPAAAKFKPEELQPQPIIKKSKKTFVPDDNKDDKYWRRRNKNNVAAKRSREARRAKENQIIMRAGFLETENERLTRENAELQDKNILLSELVQELQARLNQS